jgi:Family of unknown function (DUF6069)
MTDTLRSPISPDSTEAPTRPFWYIPAATTLAATALWLVAVPLAGVELFVDQGGTIIEVSPVSVVLGSAVGGFGTMAVGWAARRWFPRPRRHFVLTTGLMLAFSLISPVTAATTMTTALWLSSMHLVVGAIAIPVVAGRLPSRTDSDDPQE